MPNVVSTTADYTVVNDKKKHDLESISCITVTIDTTTVQTMSNCTSPASTKSDRQRETGGGVIPSARVIEANKD